MTTSGLKIAVDFDGTVVEDARPLRWKAGAREFLVAAKSMGHTLILHSCRATPPRDDSNADTEASEFYSTGKAPDRVLATWRLFDEMRTFLRSQGMMDKFAFIWQMPGKPNADLFIDDKAEEPDFRSLIQQVGG